jgi:hypothetical protein
MWGLAPLVIASHHIRPAHAGQWITLIVGLNVVFAVLGALLALFAGLFLVFGETLSSGRFRDRSWAYALAAPLLIVAAYVIESIAIHWSSFGASFFGNYLWTLALLGVGWIAAYLGVAGAYRTIVTRWSSVRPATLAWLVLALSVSGTLALPFRTPGPLPVPPVSARLTPQDSKDAERAPLLFIGLDGATWRVLQPAIENGAAPTLRALKEKGIHGTVEALWPPYWSGAAWSSILTGLPRDVTGVHEDLAGTGPGLPLFQIPLSSGLALNPLYTMRSILVGLGLIRFTPPPRGLLNGKPVWQLLHEAGVDAAVVRFRFTYPPEGQADVVVSDWVGEDQWTAMGVRRLARDVVSPRDRASELAAPFERGAPSDIQLVNQILPGPAPAQPADMKANPVTELRLSLDIDGRTFASAEAIVRKNPAQPFLAVYFGGLDSVEHAFWQYGFPGDFPSNPPAREDVDRLGHVLSRYVGYFDERLSRLLSRYEQTPNVLIVSDHGMGPTTISSEFRGWHAKEGVFLAAGPSVPHSPRSIDVSYYDVLPTILRLKGFETPEVLKGRPVLSDDDK